MTDQPGTPPPPEPGPGGTPPPPPPPPGGYGAPPPPPPPGGYGAPPPPPPAGGAPGGQYSVGDAFSYGWKKFQEHLSPTLLAMLIYGVGAAVLFGIYYFIYAVLASVLIGTPSTATFDPNTGALVYSGGTSGLGFVGFLLLTALSVLVASIIAYVIQAGVTNGALAVVRGEQITIGSFFKFQPLNKIIVASLILALLTGVGFLLCYLPGVIIAFLSYWFLYFLLDKDVAPFDSIKESWSFFFAKPVTFLYVILAGLINAVGAMLCGIGLLVTLPLTIYGAAYTFRRLNDEAVAP